jgi:hypothetical protein
VGSQVRKHLAPRLFACEARKNKEIWDKASLFILCLTLAWFCVIIYNEIL